MSDQKFEMPREIAVNVNGEERTLTMSFGLQRELVALVGSMENLSLAMVDPEMTVPFLGIALTEREKGGRPKQFKDGKPVFFDASYVEISDEHRELVLAWAYAAVTDFFLKRLQAVESTMKASGPEFARLNSSANGLRASILQARSAGPSEPSQAS